MYGDKDFSGNVNKTILEFTIVSGVQLAVCKISLCVFMFRLWGSLCPSLPFASSL